MKTINECNLLKPAGHYSLASVHNNMVYISGQLPINHENGEKVFGSISNQVSTVLNNLEIILNEAGISKDKVLKVSIYIPDVNLWSEANDVYSNFFKDHKPETVIVPTRELHYGFSIEIDAIAYI